MKTRIIAIVAGAILIAPALVFAQDGSVSANAQVDAEVHASTTKPRPPLFPKPGEVVRDIKGIASTTRKEIRAIATSTRADIRLMASTTRKEMHDMASSTRALMMEKRDTLKLKIEEAKTKAKEKFSEAVQNSVGAIVDRLTKAVDRLTSVAVRADAFIKEQQGKGKNMDSSVSALAQATTDIGKANDAITTVSAAISTALSNKTPKADMPKIRVSVKAAEDALKTAKESLHKTLQTIKIETGATSTSNVTTQ